eukprot:812756-Amphidinium_carterae.1
MPWETTPFLRVVLSGTDSAVTVPPPPTRPLAHLVVPQPVPVPKQLPALDVPIMVAKRRRTASKPWRETHDDARRAVIET